MRVYLAGRFGRRDEFIAYLPKLETAGLTNGARWLTDETNMEGSSDEDRQRFAIMDMEDVAKSDALIFFSEKPNVDGSTRGGRHVEMGAAIAMNKPVVIVGPRENVFHYLPGLPCVGSVEEAINLLLTGEA